MLVGTQERSFVEGPTMHRCLVESGPTVNRQTLPLLLRRIRRENHPLAQALNVARLARVIADSGPPS